jgi:hypothetical protein
MWKALQAWFRSPARTRAPSDATLDGEARAIAALLQCELLIHELIDQRFLSAEEMEASLESLAQAQVYEGQADPARAEVLLRVAGILRRSAASLARIRSE